MDLRWFDHPCEEGATGGGGGGGGGGRGVEVWGAGAGGREAHV
jgi:hypothetical protein